MAMLYIMGYTLSYSHTLCNGNVMIMLYVINMLLAMTILYVMRHALSYSNDNALCHGNGNAFAMAMIVLQAWQ